MMRIPLTLFGLASVVWCLAQGVSGEALSYPLVAGFERFYPPGITEEKLAEGGRLLLQELNCVACHQVPDGWKGQLGKRGMVSLKAVGSRMAAEDMRSFIRDPHGEKPGTLMPSVLHGDAAATKMEVDALVAYLETLRKPARDYPEGNVERGSQLFHTIGCVACHAPASADRFQPPEATPGMEVEKPRLSSIPLELGKNYHFHSLAEFIQDPLAVRHGGRMPSLEMNDQEAADIAAFIQNGVPAKSEKSAAEPASADLRQRGRELFSTLRCVACHDTGETVEPVALVSLDKMLIDKGCLSGSPPASAPRYALSPHQRQAITAALLGMQNQPQPPALSASEKSAAFMVKMNCYACHQWEGQGGLEKARAQYFTVSEASAHSLGEIGMLPPKLDGAGRKLTRKWMEKLLWGEKGGVRPYMTARMPRFGKENSESFITTFAEACENDHSTTMDTSGLARHHRAEYGRVLMGTGQKGLGCISCHGLKDQKSLGVPVVNLSSTVERLKPEYFKELLLNPQTVQPGTLMPPLFEGRKRAALEVEELWTYLKEIDQSRLPDGMLLEGTYELKPEKEGKPLVFRTFLVGAGMEAIAVGFPQRIHTAFDAHEIRWALTWEGRFIDAATTWEERAMTPAKPLGDEVFTFPSHMPLARSGPATEAWPDEYGTQAGYRFTGFRYDKEGVPVFSYTVGGLTIRDSMRADGDSLRRRVEISGSGEGWFFRGVAGNAAPVPVIFEEGKAYFEEVIKP